MLFEQPGQQKISHALIVVGVQPKQFSILIERLLLLAELVECPGQREPRSHIGTRLQVSPELAAKADASLGPDRASASIDAASIPVERFPRAGARFTQDHARIGTIWRHR